MIWKIVHGVAATFATVIVGVTLWEIVTTGNVTFKGHATRVATASEVLLFLTAFGFFAASTIKSALQDFDL